MIAKKEPSCKCGMALFGLIASIITMANLPPPNFSAVSPIATERAIFDFPFINVRLPHFEIS
jgi:hypothetical protein